MVLKEKAWDLDKDSKSEREISKKAFIASWFDESTNQSITAIGSAIEECGYESICIKDDYFKEMISDRALGGIRQSKFVVVDLTGQRPSVFYEAGFARGLDIECIYVYKDEEEKTSTLEFYVKHYQCYSYKDHSDLKDKLVDAIKARIGIFK